MLTAMKVIVTGATGMVGEGVPLECLASSAVDRVLSVSRRPCGHTHPKLEECLVADFRELGAVEPRLAGYDACFYCAGVKAMIRCVQDGPPRHVLEVADIAALAKG